MVPEMQQSQDFSRGLYLGSHSTPFAFELVSRTRLNSATALKAGTVLALTGFLYTAVLVDLAHDWWTDPSASYGVLIPPLVILIAWMRRKETLAHPAREDSRGLFSPCLRLCRLPFRKARSGVSFCKESGL